MAKTRFEPDKDGEYNVSYINDDGFMINETIKFNRKTNKWVGTQEDSFYKEKIRSWTTADNSPIM